MSARVPRPTTFGGWMRRIRRNRSAMGRVFAQHREVNNRTIKPNPPYNTKDNELDSD